MLWHIGKILPKDILDIPQKGCINVHGSLLPKYRGAAPIQWAILNGDKKTGITTMYMDVGMDTGDMILKKETEIGEDETTGELWERLAVLGAETLVETLEQIKNGNITRTKQGNDFSLAPMLDKSMARIDWDNKTSEQINNLIRGLNPIMGAYTIINDKKYKFWKAKVLGFEEFSNYFDINIEEIKQKENGEILLADNKKGLYFKAKDGVLKIIEIQGENAKKMSAEDFLRGNKI